MGIKTLLKRIFPLPAMWTIRANRDLINYLNRKFSLLNVLMKRLLVIESLIEGIMDSIDYSKKMCPICEAEFNVYMPFGENLRKNAQCPNCGSVERHRALWLFFEDANLLKEDKGRKINLLHFAPEKVFHDIFMNSSDIEYYPVDFNANHPLIRDVVDIQQIQYEDDMFDMIICTHVLEHVPDDKLAMRELYRVLKSGGTAFLNSPVFNIEETIEDPDYNTPQLRLKYYGQSDHYRKYGNDYTQRLESVGFEVELIEPNRVYTNEQLIRYGLSPNERIYTCKKNK